MKSLAESLGKLSGSVLKSVAAYTADEQYLELEFSKEVNQRSIEFTVKIRGRENIEILSSEDLEVDDG